MADLERNIIQKYNRLNGKMTGRKPLAALLQATEKADPDSPKLRLIAQKLKKALDRFPEKGPVRLLIDPVKLPEQKPALKKTPEDTLLYGIEVIENEGDLGCPFHEGLAGDVSTYRIVTDLLIERIKKKGLMWRKPWRGDHIFATNFVSKKAYTGINWLLLNSTEEENPYWLTFNQIEKLGGKLKKSAKGTIVVYYSFIRFLTHEYKGGKIVKLEKEKKISERRYHQLKDKIEATFEKEGKSKTFIAKNTSSIFKNIGYLKYYRVFNGQNITGIDWKITEKPKKEKIESAEAIVEGMPQRPEIIQKGQEAFYRPSLDNVTVPPLSSFNTEQSFYSTLFHELVHATGHPRRIGRIKGRKFGDERYSFEELIAEIGAAFLSAEAGILYFTLNNSAAYIKGWEEALLMQMEQDEKFILKAAAQSQKAADYILRRGDFKDLKPTPGKTAQNQALKNSPRRPAGIPVKVRSKAPALAGFTPLGQMPEKPKDTFRLPGQIGQFLGDMQRYKLVISIDGETHAGKSELAKQIADAFADAGYSVGWFDLEQGGLSSKDTLESFQRNVKPANFKNIQVAGQAAHGIDSLREVATKFDMVAVDSGTNISRNSNAWVESLREEFPKTIFLLIFQQNAQGGTRGGSAVTFDAPIHIKAYRPDWMSYQKNYARFLKNRGNPTDLQYMIAEKKVIDLMEAVKEENQVKPEKKKEK